MTIQLLTCCGPSKQLRSCCVMCFLKRWYRLFLLWRDGVYSHFTLNLSLPLFLERSFSCSWTSKHTLLCYASGYWKDYMPGRLWCIVIPKSHQRAVAYKSGMFRRETEVCNREWKVPSYRSSHTGDINTQDLMHQIFFSIGWISSHIILSCSFHKLSKHI